jgi:hypothetical protein
LIHSDMKQVDYVIWMSIEIILLIKFFMKILKVKLLL